MRCPACLVSIESADYLGLADHLVGRAAGSDSGHVRWLNQNVTRARSKPEEILPAVRKIFEVPAQGLGAWIKQRFISKFYGPKVHPFVEALQHPSREVLLGYAIEHQHFLRQWVRSCAHIIARSDQDDVIRYELENLNSEFGGYGNPERSHYRLLLKMGESLGMSAEHIRALPPLPTTHACLEAWETIATELPWLDAMAAMHSLELIASRDLVMDGASMPYFDPRILEGSEITGAAKAFLREGYEADVGHSEGALRLVERFAAKDETVASVQATCLRSFDLFDDYLIARLERGESLGR